ncbi:hypothetical protein REPUB_Repub17cG0093000 [Reevesia pubescens]
MDGYLNYLSLVYDSVWDTTPSWCQPWPITLTGLLVIASSWLILPSIVVSAVATLGICTWWYIFLYSYPKLNSYGLSGYDSGAMREGDEWYRGYIWYEEESMICIFSSCM